MLYLTTMQKPVFNAAVIFHLTHIKTSSAILLWLGIGDTEPSSLSRVNQQGSSPVRSMKPIGTLVEAHIKGNSIYRQSRSLLCLRIILCSRLTEVIYPTQSSFTYF